MSTLSETRNTTQSVPDAPEQLDDEPPKPKDYITYYYPSNLSEVMNDLLISSKKRGRISFVYEKLNLIEIYRPIVEKFLDINTPMRPFETELNDKQLHITLQGLFWLLNYDMISEDDRSESVKDEYRSSNENFSMYFAQIYKKILNSKNVFSAKFMGLWSIVACSTIFSFLLELFQSSEISNNIEFVIQIEKYINTVIIGIPPENMKEFHKSVLGLVKKEIRKDFPTYIIVNEPENETINFNSKSLLSTKSENKEKKKICKPTSSNKVARPRRPARHDRSGLPIAQSAEVFKKTDVIADDYNVERTKQLFQICAQEEFYVESKEVPPITPLGITFEDFPKPHLPLDYYNPRDPRRRVIKRVKTFRTSKNAPKRRYRIIPEPDETIGKIRQINDYLLEHQIFNL